MARDGRGRASIKAKGHRAPPGSPPGEPVHDRLAPKPRLTVFGYGPDSVVEEELKGVGELDAHLERYPVVWVNVAGLGDPQVVSRVASAFGLHRLAVEDVVHVHQRPKVEVYGEHVFVVLRVLTREEAGSARTEQLSIFFGPRFVLSFEERPAACLDPIRERLRRVGPRMHGRGPDYLAYAMIDAVVDEYFPLLEQLGDRLDEMEDQVLAGPKVRTGEEVHAVKSSLLRMRRAVWPMRDAIVGLIRDPIPGMTDETRVYLRDCSDHADRVIDLLEAYREHAADVMSLYVSSVGNRMNEVMKVLTVVATIFIPLTFIAGIYGMNFDRDASPWNMPELGWTFGYPVVLLVMLLVAVAMLYFFGRRGWLGSREERDERRRPSRRRVGKAAGKS